MVQIDQTKKWNQYNVTKPLAITAIQNELALAKEGKSDFKLENDAKFFENVNPTTVAYASAYTRAFLDLKLIHTPDATEKEIWAAATPAEIETWGMFRDAYVMGSDGLTFSGRGIGNGLAALLAYHGLITAEYANSAQTYCKNAVSGSSKKKKEAKTPIKEAPIAKSESFKTVDNKAQMDALLAQIATLTAALAAKEAPIVEEEVEEEAPIVEEAPIPATKKKAKKKTK